MAGGGLPGPRQSPLKQETYFVRGTLVQEEKPCLVRWQTAFRASVLPPGYEDGYSPERMDGLP